MNYRGSYRKLLGNAQEAIISAIEIYNKPALLYRDECVTILLINAWELLFKALLSRHGASIFYKKRRKEPYKTLSWIDAYRKSEVHIPVSLSPLAIKRNLDFISTYRDNSVHFYNTKDFGVVIYALAQTCIKNFRDLLHEKFNIALDDRINWQILPIGIRPPVDIASFLGSYSAKKPTAAVRQFLSELARASNEVENANQDRGRLLTVFKVRLESVKKIGDADAQVAITPVSVGSGPLAIVRTQDPNTTHPLRQTEVVRKIGKLHGKNFTPYVFQAIAWKHKLKEKPQYCWIAKEGVLTRYSNDILTYVTRLTSADIDAAITDYRAYLKSSQKKSKSA